MQVAHYLGMQLLVVLSTSHVEKSFMGTGLEFWAVFLIFSAMFRPFIAAPDHLTREITKLSTTAFTTSSTQVSNNPLPAPFAAHRHFPFNSLLLLFIFILFFYTLFFFGQHNPPRTTRTAYQTGDNQTMFSRRSQACTWGYLRPHNSWGICLC